VAVASELENAWGLGFSRGNGTGRGVEGGGGRGGPADRCALVGHGHASRTRQERPVIRY
jgi:hypothetical protein